MAAEWELALHENPSITTAGFRPIEGESGRAWRWALGERQQISFRNPFRRLRIYYRLFVPVAGTTVELRQGEKTCLLLEATEANRRLEGYFELPESGTEELRTLEFRFNRKEGVLPHPADPQLSFSIEKLNAVPLESPGEFTPEARTQVRTALVALPAWDPSFPPMGISYLAAALRAEGIEASVHDFNIAAWHVLRNLRIGGEDLWSHTNARYFREAELFEAEILPQLREAIENLANQICSAQPAVLGFTAFYTSLPCLNAVARACRARLPNLKIVCGGPEMAASNLPYILERLPESEINVVAIGEGEGTLLELLKRWNHGQGPDGCAGTVHKRRDGTLVTEAPRASLPFHAVPDPDFSDFDLRLYKEPKTLPVMLSRGCVARCAFCSESRFWQKFRSGPADRAFRQILKLIDTFGVEHICFNDSLVNGNFDVLSELTNLILASGRKLTWRGQARVDKRMTRELLERMARSGCQYLSYGFESGSQKVVDRMEKRTTVDIAREVIRNTHEAGIKVNLNVIVGFPGEEEEDFQQTIEFLRENLPYVWQVGINEMNIFHGIPVGDNPARYALATHVPHTGSLWETADGRNTPAVRKDRLARIRSFTSAQGIQQGLGSSSM